jgi:hypothetical protein
MPNELYCSIIGMTNGTIQTNILLTGDAKDSPIGVCAEQKAVEVFKELCSLMSDELRDTIKSGKSIFDIETLSNMFEEGLLESHCGVKVYITWPRVIKVA